MRPKVRIYLYIILACLLGCSNTFQKDGFEVYSNISLQDSWQENAKWAFVLLNEQGEISRSIVLRFTDETANSCTAGDYKKIEILQERPLRSKLYLGEAAYTQVGSLINIDLAANLCDAGHQLIGKIKNQGIDGKHFLIDISEEDNENYFYAMKLDQ